jgi:predicted dehydrogenase/nucleoside-diphosphate-sugar epimerase
MTKAKVCLVGAGSISDAHAHSLRALGIPIAAVVDPSARAREKLANKWKVPAHFASTDEALAANVFDRAHVLVPPDFHAAVALPLLKAGKAVLLEKPLAVSLAECDELIAAAGGASALLGVNQNFVYHPAFLKLRQALAAGALGQPQFAQMFYHAPLRQLASRQFGHWMFRRPANILLEQAVHPLSQLLALCGTIKSIKAVGEDPIAIAPGVNLFPSFTATVTGASLPASFRFGVGQNFPFWQVTVACDDGILVADILSNRFWTVKRTRWMDAADNLASGHATAWSIARESWSNFLGYGFSMLGLGERADGFYRSMRESIRAFHAAADAGQAPLADAAFGRRLVELCDEVAAQIMPAPSAEPRAAAPAAPFTPDVAVLGGTGFIGTALVRRLRAEGFTVAVMARNLANLPAVFQDSGVKLHRGDIRNPGQVSDAIAGAKYVINLAHGGGGASWEEIRDAMLGGAENVAKACLAAKTARLIHVGSIASLYLGPQSAPVTGATPPDPQAGARAHYAHAKVLCDQRLMQMHSEDGLPVCIVRPGLVVGEGTSPFHSGLGFFNNDQHCIGWNDGRNPLPFVLVDDVADAIVRSLNGQVDGKSYNLVGDVRPNARDYIAALGRVLNRPLYFHPNRPQMLYLNELGKWAIKRVGGRKVDVPSQRDLLSRGLKAVFDCGDIKRELGWSPVSDSAAFYTQAFKAGAGE